MTGPYDSIIGVEKELIVKRFLTAMPVRMEAAKRDVELHSVIIDVDELTGKATSIRRHTLQGD
jgi:calcineurin-like phosphoesterase